MFFQKLFPRNHGKSTSLGATTSKYALSPLEIERMNAFYDNFKQMTADQKNKFLQELTGAPHLTLYTEEDELRRRKDYLAYQKMVSINDRAIETVLAMVKDDPSLISQNI
ncbi:MAG: hypothetical protein WAZ18_02515 [Alphaproteobacteria bacterium]